MSRRPNVSQALAMKAAAAAAREVEQDDADASLAPASLPEAASPPAPSVEDPQTASVETHARLVGRPKGRRPVAARQTVYLDDARHAALTRIAEDRGRSIHSLIIEGIDHIIGKPSARGWQ